MKKNIGIVCIGLTIAFVGVSFSSAQSAYRERVLIQRHSLLAGIFSFWPFSDYTRGVRAPDPVPVNNLYRDGVIFGAPTSRPPMGAPTPVGNGSGPVGSGGSCASCVAGSTLQNGNCVASGGGSGACNGTSEPACIAVISSITGRACEWGYDTAGPACDDSSCPPPPPSSCADSFRHGKCLSYSSLIATPIGDVPVISLKAGDIVWTTDAVGNRIVRSLIKVSRVPVANHHVVHLVLADGRMLDVSAPHPTADGRMVGDLKAGNAYDGSTVESAVLKSYEGTATYDILPAGDTGYYWANGILMGSTLK